MTLDYTNVSIVQKVPVNLKMANPLVHLVRQAVMLKPNVYLVALFVLPVSTPIPLGPQSAICAREVFISFKPTVLTVVHVILVTLLELKVALSVMRAVSDTLRMVLAKSCATLVLLEVINLRKEMTLAFLAK